MSQVTVIGNGASALGGTSATGVPLVSVLEKRKYDLSVYQSTLTTSAASINDLNRVTLRDFGAVGDGVADDTAAFQALASNIASQVAGGTWPVGFLEVPRIIDGEGLTYLVSASVQLGGNVELQNMTLLLDECTLTLGAPSGAAPSAPRVHLTNGFSAIFAGDADYAAGLVEMPRGCGCVVDETCAFDGGLGVNRARYGLYAGETSLWGSTFRGSYRGGECALRIGSESDHTSNVVEPAVVDHARVVGVLLCNPKNVTVKADMENMDGDAPVLAITSETNGSNDVAEGVEIRNGYAFNACADALSSDGNAAILIGHDVPGTEGWDGPGVITSTASARMIEISDMYVVSNHAEIGLKIAAGFGVTIERVTWGGAPTGANPQVMAEFSGVCASTRVRSCRNQNTGVTTPVYRSTASQRILAGREPAAFQPALVSSTGGDPTPTYSTREGLVQVIDGMATLTCHLAWSAISGGSGNAQVSIPAAVLPVAPWRAAAAAASGDFTPPVQGIVFSDGVAAIKLLDAGLSTFLPVGSLPATGSLHFTVSFPVDLAQ